MKYLALTVLWLSVLVISTSSTAQDYTPFPEENSFWVAYEKIHENYHRNYEIETDGTLPINGFSYVKLTLRERRQKLNESGGVGEW